MTVSNVWDDDVIEDIWDILEDGLEDVLEGSGSYDDDSVVYYMTEWSATPDTSDRRIRRIRRRLSNNGRRLLATTTSSPETSSSGSSVFGTTAGVTEGSETTAILTEGDSVETTTFEASEASEASEATEATEAASSAETTDDESTETNESTSSGESSETQSTESGESSSDGSGSGSVTFDFTIRVYGGDDETVVTSLYDYLLDLGTSFASDYENNILQLSQTFDSQGFGEITINSAAMKLYDNDANEVQSTTGGSNSGTNSAFAKHATIGVVLSSVVLLFA